MNASAFQTAILWVHRLVTASLAFLVALVLLGGPLGLVPALASLQATARGWNDAPSPAYGTFGRLWRGAVAAWRASLPGLVPLAVIAAAIAAYLLSRSTASLVVLIVVGAWALMVVNHMALRLSLGLAAWGGAGEIARFLALGWLHLVSVAAWVALVALTKPVSPFLLPLFGPAILTLALDRLGYRAARIVLAPTTAARRFP